MNTIKDFVLLYQLYRKHHSRMYAVRRAYQITFVSFN